ncbi:MAG: DUF2339 domain-containing protein [Tepidisphaeraceae bacterium]
MRDVGISERVTDLEQRVQRIERRLQMSAALASVQAGGAEPAPTMHIGQVTPAPLPAPLPREDAGRDASGSHSVPLPPPPMVDNERSNDAAASPVLPYAPKIAPVAPPQAELEQTIGLRWAGWVGAVVLVIGAGLGIKYAYDQGWFSLLPAALRLAMMSLGSFALIGAGEWVRRKVSDAAAVGLFGAGVATLFLVAYAGHGYLGLYQPQTAFTLMGLTTLIGAAVAMRGRMVSIAVLALIGGNLAPLVLHADVNLAVPFLSYLLMLQVVAIALSWWGGSARWRVLRGLSLATTSIWAAKILFGPAGAGVPTTIFLLLYAALYHVELIASALRRRRDDGDAKKPGDAHVDGALFSTFVTALTTLALLWVARDATATVRGLSVMSIALACGVVGSVLALRKHDALRPLSISLRTQAAALLMLAVPITFDGATISLAWSVLAITFAALGAKLNLRSMRSAAALAWVLALGNLLLWAGTSVEANQTWLTIAGAALPAKWGTAMLLALIGQVVAWLTGKTREEAGDGQSAVAVEESLASSRRDRAAHLHASRVIAAGASVFFVIATIAWLPTLAATVALVALAWWLVVTDLLDTRIGWLAQAGTALAIAMMKWAIVDTLSQRLAPGWSAAQYSAILNPLTGAGVLISASLVGIYFARRRAWTAMWSKGEDDATDRMPLVVIASLVGVLITLALTFDLDRVIEVAAVSGRVGGWPMWQVKQTAWTMLWTVAGLGIPTLAARLLPAERRIGFARTAAMLVCAMAVKFLVLDALLWRLTGDVAITTIGANVQTLAAAFVVGALTLVMFLVRHDAAAAIARRFSGILAVLVIALVASLEIDRAFEQFARTAGGPFADPRQAKQVALSIFWSAFAISSVVAGFRVRIAGLRYFGLAMFGLTLLKVVLVDLADASRGYRILSFMGLGLLLLGTSVLYGKLSPKLLRAPAT